MNAKIHTEKDLPYGLHKQRPLLFMIKVIVLLFDGKRHGYNIIEKILLTIVIIKK